ncbi:unnamed protein product, partial [Allacma fusca]
FYFGEDYLRGRLKEEISGTHCVEEWIGTEADAHFGSDAGNSGFHLR